MVPELPAPVYLVHDGRQVALAIVDCKAVVSDFYPGRLNHAHRVDWGVVVGDLQRLEVQKIRAAGLEVVHNEVVDALAHVRNKQGSKSKQCITIPKREVCGNDSIVQHKESVVARDQVQQADLHLTYIAFHKSMRSLKPQHMRAALVARIWVQPQVITWSMPKAIQDSLVMKCATSDIS